MLVRPDCCLARAKHVSRRIRPDLFNAIDPTPLSLSLLAWKLMMLAAGGPSLFVKNEKRLGKSALS
jgi:hypothetical protein